MFGDDESVDDELELHATTMRSPVVANAMTAVARALGGTEEAYSKLHGLPSDGMRDHVGSLRSGWPAVHATVALENISRRNVGIRISKPARGRKAGERR